MNQIKQEIPLENKNQIIFPCKVKDLIDKIISHNEIVSLWYNKKEDGHSFKQRQWRGMAWDIPDEFVNQQFVRIFGTIAGTIGESDAINILVIPNNKNIE